MLGRKSLQSFCWIFHTSEVFTKSALMHLGYMLPCVDHEYSGSFPKFHGLLAIEDKIHFPAPLSISHPNSHHGTQSQFAGQ